MPSTSPRAIELFRALDIEQVWLVDGSDASEAIYLIRPVECDGLDREAVETELIDILEMKIYFGPLRAGVRATLVYLRDHLGDRD